MLVSMTGYGSGEVEAPNARFRVEVRTVNHRFCDIAPKLPREYLSLEGRLVAEAKLVCKRGHVEISLRRVDALPGGGAVRIDEEVATALYGQMEALSSRLGFREPPRLSDILSLEGVVRTSAPERDLEADWPYVCEAFRRAWDAVESMRRLEGEALTRDIKARVGTLRLAHQEIQNLSARLREELEQRLYDRVQEAMTRMIAGEIDRPRLLQEVVYLVDRSDVSEEITRLGSHIRQLEALLAQEGNQGKRIEFLLQETLREANTIGSKTAHVDVVHHTIAIKVELEKIREQIQNVE